MMSFGIVWVKALAELQLSCRTIAVQQRRAIWRMFLQPPPVQTNSNLIAIDKIKLKEGPLALADGTYPRVWCYQCRGSDLIGKTFSFPYLYQAKVRFHN